MQDGIIFAKLRLSSESSEIHMCRSSPMKHGYFKTSRVWVSDPCRTPIRTRYVLETENKYPVFKLNDIYFLFWIREGYGVIRRGYSKMTFFKESSKNYRRKTVIKYKRNVINYRQ